MCCAYSLSVNELLVFTILFCCPCCCCSYRRNHFQQSYMLQVQWILESVFARMGVQFVARNFGNGGLGTVHNRIAAGDIYGQDVDMLMWDSGMTEKNNRDIELMHRQGLLASPHKIPVLWTQSARIAREYNQAAGGMFVRNMMMVMVMIRSFQARSDDYDDDDDDDSNNTMQS